MHSLLRMPKLSIMNLLKFLPSTCTHLQSQFFRLSFWKGSKIPKTKMIPLSMLVLQNWIPAFSTTLLHWLLFSSTFTFFSLYSSQNISSSNHHTHKICLQGYICVCTHTYSTWCPQFLNSYCFLTGDNLDWDFRTLVTTAEYIIAKSMTFPQSSIFTDLSGVSERRTAFPNLVPGLSGKMFTWAIDSYLKQTITIIISGGVTLRHIWHAIWKQSKEPQLLKHIYNFLILSASSLWFFSQWRMSATFKVTVISSSHSQITPD